MRNIGFKLLIFFLAVNVIASAQTFSYYDANSGSIRYIEGLTGKKNKIKKGIKQGRIEQVILIKEIKFLDDSKYIPDIESSIIDTNISVKQVASIKDTFFVFVGNYIDGIKQGEFKLLRVEGSYGRTREIASMNYLNDTINGSIAFNTSYFYYKSSFYGPNAYLKVLINNTKIMDQELKISDKHFLIYKNNLLDSGYISKDNFDFYFKKLNQVGNVILTFSSNENAYTKLTLVDGNEAINRSNIDGNDNGYFRSFSCIGFNMDLTRYYTFEIINGMFVGRFNCYYKNDNINYSVNIDSNIVDLWVDNNIDDSLPIFELEKKRPSVNLEDLLSLWGSSTGAKFINYDNNLNYLKKGYYKISRIKGLELNKEKNYFGFYPPKSFTIKYEIENHIIRNETWNDKRDYNFTNYDINGNIQNSTDFEKQARIEKRNEETKAIEDLLGFKKATDIIPCEYCGKKFMKKNGVSIQAVQCKNTRIPCFTGYMNMKPCELSFCSNKCSNEYQCAKCSDINEYRENCD